MPELSLVIPCFNEGRNLPGLAERLARLAGSDMEVILVDNGSTDDTASILPALITALPFCKIITVPVNQGYGHGILSGLRVATGRYIGWTHADLQTDPADALRALKIIAAADGDIFLKGLRYGRPLGDRVFTWGMAFFESLLSGTAMWDINAQPTIFPKSFFQRWETPPDDFALDLYAYWLAKKSGLPVRRFPVHFGPRAFGSSSWNAGWASRWKFIKRTISFSFNLRGGVR